MKTILVPVDFSPASNAACKFAQRFAIQTRSSVILLHVVEAVDEGSFNIEGEAVASASWEDKLFNMKMIEKAKKDLSLASASMANNGIDVKSIVRVGDAYHGIQCIIREQKADLVIMGTEGNTGVGHMLVGSNTEKVVRRSGCPVISVNRDTTFDSLKSIVWATSLKAEDLDIPVILRELINETGVTVHIVRINTPGLFLSDSVTKDKLKSIADHMKFKNHTINIYNDLEETSGIIRFAATVNADLIALSTHGRQGLAHLLNGSIAENVINHTKRPVMTYVIGGKEK